MREQEQEEEIREQEQADGMREQENKAIARTNREEEESAFEVGGYERRAR